MTEEIELQNQIEFLYKATSKQLYNLALYAIGNQRAAEQITTQAFADAFLRDPDKFDTTQFSLRSISLLYLYGRKLRKKTVYNISEIMLSQKAKRQENHEKKLFLEILRAFSYDERYILLLFYWMRIPLKQIASITGRPVFITRKRLLATMNKVITLRENYYYSPEGK